MTPTYFQMNEMLTIFMYHEKLTEALSEALQYNSATMPFNFLPLQQISKTTNC